MSRKASSTHHITYDHQQSNWKVLRGGAERAVVRCDSKQQAIDVGREISRNQGTELKIHNRDGKISQSDSHGHDPHPPKG